MRILLSLMFLAPIVAYAALQSGADRVTPYLIAMAVVAICAQILVERRKAAS